MSWLEYYINRNVGATTTECSRGSKVNSIAHKKGDAKIRFSEVIVTLPCHFNLLRCNGVDDKCSDCDCAVPH